jgi:hypothetical protein
MDIGAAGGNLILFFSVLVGLILVALLVFSYAAYSFLLTLINTAAGNDEVIWPGDPIQDWLFKVWYLGWLLALWTVPASFIVGVFGLPRPLFMLCVAAVVWLMFPVGLLSSLSAESRLVVFRPVIARLLLKHVGPTLRFYGSSGLVVLVGGAFSYAALFGLHSRVAAALDQPVLLVPLAAALGAAGCLIYGRLLGRIALIISRSDSASRKKRHLERPQEVDRVESFDPWSTPEANLPAEDKPRPRHHEPRKELPKKKQLQAGKPKRAFDPWAVPAEEPIRKPARPSSPTPGFPDDPYGPAEGSYEVMAEGAAFPPEPSPPFSRLEEKVESYGVSASSEGAPSKLPPPVLPEVSKLEEELAAPRRLPPLPDRPLLAGVYSFPFYQQAIGPFGTLAFGFLGVLALSRLLLHLFPF